MKSFLIMSVVFLGMMAVASAQTYSTPATTKKVVHPRPAPPISQGEVTGVVPRALRGGNPVQMLNPRAPAKYGTAQESVAYDPHNPGKWRGIKLLTFLF